MLLFMFIDLPIAPAEAHKRGEKFSGPGMETDHFCTKKSATILYTAKLVYNRGHDARPL